MKKTAFLNTTHTKSVLLCLALGLAASQAEATTITENVSGTLNGIASSFGQSITTPAGGPWDHLTFNFVDASDSPFALGELFLLTQSYAGTPGALSAATPGFLASTSTISSGVWSFATNVSLDANTPYFLYMGTSSSVTLKFSTSDPYAGGIVAGVPSGGGGGGNFSVFTTFDLVFNLSGDVVVASVPEPGTAPLMGLALVGLVAARRRSRSI